MGQEVSNLAARQWGNVTRKQLVALGVSPAQIAAWVRKGWLIRVHLAVYAVGRPPRTVYERAAAALLACGPGAALSHSSAMALWGFWKRWESPLEVTVPGNRRPAGIRIHRSPGAGTTVHLGLRVTTPVRALQDVAPRLTDGQLTRAVNQALLSRQVSRAALESAGARIREALDGRATPTRSAWEDGFPAFCARHGLPKPVMGARLGAHTVDAYFPEQRVIVELDSWTFHQSRQAFEADRERDTANLAAGRVTVRLTWTRSEHRAADEAARLRQILDGRA